MKTSSIDKRQPSTETNDIVNPSNIDHDYIKVVGSDSLAFSCSDEVKFSSVAETSLDSQREGAYRNSVKCIMMILRDCREMRRKDKEGKGKGRLTMSLSL